MLKRTIGLKSFLAPFGIALACAGFSLGPYRIAAAIQAVGKADSAINLQAIDGKTLKRAVADLKGKVVVVNLWATWCGPCVAEFPDLVRLHTEFRQKGLVVIAASVDEPEDKAKVAEFLKDQDCSFHVFMRKAGSIDGFIDPLDKSWSGAVPTTYIFSKDGGKPARVLTGLKSYEQFVAATEPLLK